MASPKLSAPIDRRRPGQPIGRLVVLATAVLLTAGCGSGGVPLGSVSGHVTKGGKPQAGVTVIFDPASGGRRSEALTDASGRYELVFSAERKGALLGQHQVIVEIKERYNDFGDMTHPAQKYLTVQREVQSGSNTFDFDIGQDAEKSN